MTALLQISEVSPAIGFADETQSRPGNPGLFAQCCAQALGLARQFSLPHRSAAPAKKRKKSPDSAIYPVKSRLEPGANLGQKGALPAPWE
jgi:hypothetical protein